MNRLVLRLILLMGLIAPLSAQAASIAVTGGTNGASCDSGGYFRPSNVSANAGDTITFSVPANDPYAGGLQVNGFPGGSFVVAPGGSHTTSALTAGSINFDGTWPDETSCKKGSGTVNVAAAAVAPGSAPAAVSTRTPLATVSPMVSSSPSPVASGKPTATKAAHSPLTTGLAIGGGILLVGALAAGYWLLSRRSRS